MIESVLALVYGEESLYPKQLELHHPRILAKIVLLWHTAQMEEFFLELLVNTRSDRQGFSHEVASELFYLSEVFEGTRKLPTVFDDNPLSQLNNKLGKPGLYEHSPQDFINMRAPSNDGPWARISPASRHEIEALGYPCTADGFIKASCAKDLKAIGLFLHCNINIDTCDARGWTPLIFSAFNGNVELGKLFIEFGANVNMKDHAGFTPLHWAAHNGHTAVIKNLVAHRAEVNARSLRDWTPLMMAAANGHLAACSELLACGAEAGMVTSHGWTALQQATLNHHVPVIKLFLSLLKEHVTFIRPSAGPEHPDIPAPL